MEYGVSQAIKLLLNIFRLCQSCITILSADPPVVYCRSMSSLKDMMKPPKRIKYIPEICYKNGLIVGAAFIENITSSILLFPAYIIT